MKKREKLLSCSDANLSWKSTSSDDDLMLMFLSKKRKNWGFWFHPILTRKLQQREFHGLSLRLKLYHDSFRTFRMSVGQFELL